MEIKKGIVAFLDILGYQNLVLNNDLEKVGEILKTFNSLGLQVNKNIYNAVMEASNNDNETVNRIINNKTILHLDYNVISDSIIVVKKFDHEKETKTMMVSTFLFGMYSLFTEAMNNGIALRGAIGFGEYLSEDNIFASKEIIEAYKLSESLNFSGIVFCDSFDKELMNIYQTNEGNDLVKILSVFSAEILCPVKNTENKNELLLHVLNWTTKELAEMDIREYLYKIFSSHNRLITNQVIDKINNTEHIIRMLLTIKRKTRT